MNRILSRMRHGGVLSFGYPYFKTFRPCSHTTPSGSEDNFQLARRHVRVVHWAASRHYPCQKGLLQKGNKLNRSLTRQSTYPVQSRWLVFMTAVNSVKEGVTVTDYEEKLFQTLLGTVRHFGLKAELRVAGGWVRDKLLGLESHDIDIAVDSMMGADLATHVNAFLELQQQATSSVGVIKSNPEQSKHLETATMQIHGQWIDLVNLRAEEYAEESRIPSQKFGSAIEDALRRDLTINSLFYNITTGKVEDLTGKGLADLREGVIRTPLPPEQTFLDDPLRVLRAIRFAARFQFRVDEEAQQAARLPSVRAALGSKISRERIGKEVEAMLGGAHPHTAVHHILDLHLFATIFALPSATQPAPGDGYERECVQGVVDLCPLLHPTSKAEDRVGLLLAALLLPLRHAGVKEKKKRVPVSAAIVRESLKIKSAYADMVATLHRGAEGWQLLVPLILAIQGPVPPPLRVKIGGEQGKLIRDLREQWRSALLLSSLLDPPAAPQGCSDMKRSKRLSSAQRCAEVEECVADLGLARAWEIRPLLDGRAIKAAMGLGAGPQLGEWVGRTMDWQLANPLATPEECKEWLQSQAKG